MGKKHVLLPQFLAVCAVAAVFVLALPASALGAQVILRTRLEKLPFEGGRQVGLTRSKDGYHYAYCSRDRWVKDREPVSEPVPNACGSTDKARLSPNGTLLAFIAEPSHREAGEKSYAYMNGALLGEYDAVEELLFSPDSRHLAYAAKEGTCQSAVLDKTNKGPCVGPGLPNGLLFGPNGDSSLAYSGYPDQGEVRSSKTLFFNHRPTRELPDAAQWLLSKDWKRLATSREKDASGSYEVRVDDKPLGSAFSSPRGFVFSDKGSLAFFSLVDGTADHRVILNGSPISSVQPDPSELAFRPKGDDLFWFARPSGREQLVVNGKARHGTWHFAADLDFSPEGSHYAFLGMRSREQEAALVIDGEIVPGSSPVAPVVFDDEAELHYLAVDYDGWVSLVCVAVDSGVRASKSICARKAALLKP